MGAVVVGSVLGLAVLTSVLPVGLQGIVFRTPLAIAVLFVGTVGLLARLARPGRDRQDDGRDDDTGFRSGHAPVEGAGDGAGDGTGSAPNRPDGPDDRPIRPR